MKKVVVVCVITREWDIDPTTLCGQNKDTLEDIFEFSGTPIFAPIKRAMKRAYDKVTSNPDKHKTVQYVKGDKEVLANERYWKTFGRKFGWELFGYSYRQTATFHAAGSILHITGDQAKDILKKLASDKKKSYLSGLDGHYYPNKQPGRVMADLHHVG